MLLKMLELLEKEVEESKDPILAEHSQRFFKTGKGEYGEGDVFLGLSVPKVRAIAKKYTGIELEDVKKLLKSHYHEKRLLGLLILVNKYEKKGSNKEEIFNFYLSNTRATNNWDLVDLSAYKIVGDYIFRYKDLDCGVLRELSKSKNLWERRIAIISTMTFVKNGVFGPTVEISKTLLKNEHDLINKAVGWLLREIGKKDEAMLIKFLKDNVGDISSVTLSYAMEKLDKSVREEIRGMRGLKIKT